MPKSKIEIDLSNLSEDVENLATLALVSNNPKILNSLGEKEALGASAFIFHVRGFNYYSWLYDNIKHEYRDDFRYLHACIFRNHIKDELTLQWPKSKKAKSNWTRYYQQILRIYLNEI